MISDRITYTDNILDEIVISDCMVHLEHTDDEYYWMGIYKNGDQIASLYIEGTVGIIDGGI